MYRSASPRLGRMILTGAMALSISLGATVAPAAIITGSPAFAQETGPSGESGAESTSAVPAGEVGGTNEWMLSVSGLNPDATDFVLSIRPTVTPPGEGEQLTSANFMLTNLADAPLPIDALEYTAVDAAGNAFPSTDNACGVGPVALDSRPELQPGESTEINVCWKVLQSSMDGLQVAVGREGEQPIWFSLGYGNESTTPIAFPEPTSTPTPEPTSTPTPEPTSTPTPEPTSTPTPEPTSTPTPEPTSTPTPEPTSTPTAVMIVATPVNVATPTVSDEATPEMATPVAEGGVATGQSATVGDYEITVRGRQVLAAETNFATPMATPAAVQPTLWVMDVTYSGDGSGNPAADLAFMTRLADGSSLLAQCPAGDESVLLLNELAAGESGSGTICLVVAPDDARPMQLEVTDLRTPAADPVIFELAN